MRRRSRHLLWAALVGASAGCGPSDPPGPALPTGKVPPSLTRRVRGATLEEWLARATSPSAAVRAEAPWALVELTTDATLLRPLLERLVADERSDVRYAALVAVGRSEAELGPVLEAALLAGITAPEEGIASAARAAWVARGARSAAALGLAVAGGTVYQAREAARLLGVLGPEASAAAPSLTAALGHASIAVRLNAARALERMGALALPALAAGLASAHGEGALAILELLRGQGAGAVAAVPALVLALGAEEPEIGRAAEEALVAVGPGALAALDVRAAGEDPGAAAARRAAARIREAGGR